MITVFLIIIINIITALVTFLSSGKIIDRRRTGLKKIEKGGWYLITCFVITSLLGIFQYYHAKNEEETKEKKAEETARKDREDSNNRIIQTFTQSLAEYGLKYDSTQKIVERMIRDSAQRNTTIVQQNKPIFSLCPDPGITIPNSKADTLQFSLHFCFKGAPFNLKADLYVLEPIDGRYKLHVILKDFVTSQRGFEIDGGISKGPYPFKNHPNARYFIFYVVGKYTDRDRSETFELNNVYYYDLVKNIPGYYASEEIEKIRETIKSQSKHVPQIEHQLAPQ